MSLTEARCFILHAVEIVTIHTNPKRKRGNDLVNLTGASGYVRHNRDQYILRLDRDLRRLPALGVGATHTVSSPASTVCFMSIFQNASSFLGQRNLTRRTSPGARAILSNPFNSRTGRATLVPRWQV